MRISTKWTILFLITGGYVFFFAGIWYSGLFRWFFSEKLKQELVALLYVNQNRFISGMLSSPRTVTIEEVDTMKNFLRDQLVINAIVIDKHGRIRWSPDTALFGMRIDDLEQAQPPSTKAILRAFLTKTPKVIAFKREKKDFYEVAVPLLYHGDIKGVVSLEVSREEINASLAQGMRKFYLGAVIALAFFIGTGILFINKGVLTPLFHLKDTIDNLSLSELSWPQTKWRRDEIGDLERALASFIDRLGAMFNRMEKDRAESGDLERIRWEQILKTLIRSGGVVVLDSDNYCLAAYNIDNLIKRPSSSVKPKAVTPSKGASVSSGAVETPAHSATSRVHLLDFITSTELLQLINRALERPGSFLEENVVLDAVPYMARAMTIGGHQPQETRTVVWLDPQKA